MSFGHYTPESLLPRTDSRNPATTCKGLTTNGRRCRRALAQSPGTPPNTSPQRGNGVVAVLEIAEIQNPAAYYCWQHKDQAEGLAAQNKRTKLVPLAERTSIDTLVDQIGVMNLDEDVKSQTTRRHRRRRNKEQWVKRRDTLPASWQSIESPLMSVPGSGLGKRTSPPRSIGRSNLKASFLCCLRADDEDLPPPRRQQHHDNLGRFHNRHRSTSAAHHPRCTPDISEGYLNQPSSVTSPPSITRNPVKALQASPALYPSLPSLNDTYTPVGTMGSNSLSKPNDTQTLLSLIPKSLSPSTTSSLLAELSKPISPADEAGYIYIFWLTPESEASKPDDETASSLLDAEIGDTPDRARRRSEALHRYSSQRHPSPSGRHRGQQQARRTILLKVGRAANVHRRLTQWTKQCGQNVTLVRYYPSNAVLPHAHRVERLIHIEMAERRARPGLCEACGREHREWFEIEATRAGLRTMDECVRRWVGWGQSQPGLN